MINWTRIWQLQKMPIKLRNYAKPKSPERVPEPTPPPAPTPPPENPEPTNLPDDPSVGSQGPEHLNDKLKELYTNIKSVPGYSAKIKDFLQSYEGHNQYKRISKKIFPRRRVISRFPFDVWMADLIVYSQRHFKRANSNYSYILLLIDCFTKKIWAVPMKFKTAKWTAEALDSIFKTLDEPPINLVTDRGLEFYNSQVQQVLQSYGINHYSTPTRTKMKASVAERAIRTIKTKLQRYFDKKKTFNWRSVIEQFVENYNKTPHSAHGLAPQAVNNDNRDQVYKKMYPDNTLTTVCKLHVNDKVRVLREKEHFEKGYTKSWSQQIYVITKVLQSHKICWYHLAELDGTKVAGIFYYYQLNKVGGNAD